MAPNWTAAATLKIPIFQGGKVEADVQQTDAVMRQRQAQVDDLRGRIEQDVEDAILDLKAAAQQVEVAKTGREYAQQALGQSQDRFAAGVTNNVEVIQAQQQLASANDRFICEPVRAQYRQGPAGARHRKCRTGGSSNTWRRPAARCPPTDPRSGSGNRTRGAPECRSRRGQGRSVTPASSGKAPAPAS